MLKKVFFENSRHLKLVGSLYSASPDEIIIMVHGSGSNRFSRGVFEKIATMLYKAGYSVLAFDFSGHGESDDDIISLEKAMEDVKAAIIFVKNQGWQKIAFFGHSLGAFACLGSFCAEVKTMILIGALTGPVHWRWEDFCSSEQLQEMHEKGYITNLVNDGLREAVKVDAHLLTEILAIDQESLLRHVTCPVFMIHGDADQQELDLMVYSKKALFFLPQGSQLSVIKGASHLFVDHAHELADLTKEWFTSHYPLNV